MTEQQRHQFERGTDGPKVMSADAALEAPVADVTGEVAEDLVTEIRESAERLKDM